MLLLVWQCRVILKKSYLLFSKLLSELPAWPSVGCTYVEAHTTQSRECFLSYSAASFLGLGRLLRLAA